MGDIHTLFSQMIQQGACVLGQINEKNEAEAKAEAEAEAEACYAASQPHPVMLLSPQRSLREHVYLIGVTLVSN
jgi:hypothetical protein